MNWHPQALLTRFRETWLRQVRAFPWTLFHTGATPPVSVNINVVKFVTRKRSKLWSGLGRFARLTTPIFHTGLALVTTNQNVIRLITRKRITRTRRQHFVFRYQGWFFAGAPAPGPPSGVIWVSPFVRSSFRRGNA